MAKGRKRKTGKREPNGRIQRVPERDKGTPELQALRKAGVRDELIDTMHGAGLITDRHLEAFRIYERARRVYVGPVAPKTGALAEMIPGTGGELSTDALKAAKKAWQAGYDALGACHPSARAEVHGVMWGCQPCCMEAFLIGLDTLQAVYIGGERKAA